MQPVECIPNPDLTPDLIEKIAALKSTFWPYPIKSQIAWLRERTSPDDMHFMVWDGDQLAAYLLLVWRKTASGNRIGGLGTGVARPDKRGQGLGKTLFIASTEMIVASKCGGLYSCKPNMVQFWRSLDNWRKCEAHILGEDGKPFFVEQDVSCIGPVDERSTITILGDRF